MEILEKVENELKEILDNLDQQELFTSEKSKIIDKVLSSNFVELFTQLMHDNLRLRRMLWLNHGCEYQYLVNNNEEEMKCSKCGVDFKNMSLDEISKTWMKQLNKKE